MHHQRPQYLAPRWGICHARIRRMQVQSSSCSAAVIRAECSCAGTVCTPFQAAYAYPQPAIGAHPGTLVPTTIMCALQNLNYPGLRTLYDKYHDDGFNLIAFPCNQFGGQAPGTSEVSACKGIRSVVDMLLQMPSNPVVLLAGLHDWCDTFHRWPSGSTPIMQARKQPAGLGDVAMYM
eukprot:GHUV01031908.1.p1 GENE.GHUV01031908.1~~GHUV01031908.1.p1  ORF type:complete len:178 (+),score=25.11 GHUV01031908.1:467-1000(+)